MELNKEKDINILKRLYNLIYNNRPDLFNESLFYDSEMHSLGFYKKYFNSLSDYEIYFLIMLLHRHNIFPLQCFISSICDLVNNKDNKFNELKNVIKTLENN